MKHDKNCPLYKLELQIARNLVESARSHAPLGSHGRLNEIRTFSEKRSYGRRVKLWGVRFPEYKSTMWEPFALAVGRQVVQDNFEGLLTAGYCLSYEVYRGPSYNTLNITFHITKIGS